MKVFDFRPDEYPAGGTQWTMLHPEMELEALGFIPSFLHESDPRSAKEQINERYEFGGWNPSGGGKWRLLDDNTLIYPGDPPFRPLASTKLREELIVFYPGEFVAIIQPDRSFEVARLD